MLNNDFQNKLAACINVEGFKALMKEQFKKHLDIILTEKDEAKRTKMLNLHQRLISGQLTPEQFKKEADIIING